MGEKEDPWKKSLFSKLNQTRLPMRGNAPLSNGAADLEVWQPCFWGKFLGCPGSVLR